MAGTHSPSTLDLDGLSPDEAFTLLGNEIRLDILRVLWTADAAHRFDDGSDRAATMAYSALRRAVAVEDNGKFNYHLAELAPQFIRRTDDGYRLSGAGRQIARTIVAVSGPAVPDVSADLDEGCPFCGATLRAEYADQWLRVRCPDCEGLFGEEAPEGTLFLTQYPAGGLTGHDPDEVLPAALYRCALDIAYLMYGVCRECAGPVEATVSVCEGHDTGGSGHCEDCGTPFPAWADMRCGTCGFAKRLPVEMYVLGLVAVAGFFDAEEIDALASSVSRAVEVLRTRVSTELSTNPLRVTVAVDLPTTRFVLTLDGEMAVVNRSRTTRAGAEA